MMQWSLGPYTWQWQSDWAHVPFMKGHAHNGMQVSTAGEVFTGHADSPTILVLDGQSGVVKRSFDVPVREVHGLTLATWHQQEVLFL